MRAALACLALLLPACVGAAPATTPFWQKAWTVERVLGDRAQAAALDPVLGRTIALSPARATDPIDEDCPAGVGYDDIRSRTRADLARHFGPDWKLPADVPGRVTAGWVRCKGANMGAYIFVGPARAYRLYEDGLVIALR